MTENSDSRLSDTGDDRVEATGKPVYRALRLCTNYRAGYTLPSCGARGAKEVAEELQRQWPERNLPFDLETVHCMGKCHIGPTMKLIPGGPFILGAQTKEDVTRILDLLETGDADRAAEEYAEPKPL